MTAPITPTTLTQVITDLIELARRINLALDDSEEFEGSDGRTHAITAQHFDDICDAIHWLEALPDNKPGETLSPAGKAEWALRDLIEAREAQNSQAAPIDDLAELSLLNRLIDLGAKAAGFHAKSNSDDGHAGTAAYVQWQETRAQMGELIRAAYAAQRGGA